MNQLKKPALYLLLTLLTMALGTKANYPICIQENPKPTSFPSPQNPTPDTSKDSLSDSATDSANGDSALSDPQNLANSPVRRGFSDLVLKLETKNVQFDNQPDCPLQLVEVLLHSYPEQHEFELSFRNISNKVIRAYVINELAYDCPTSQQPMETIKPNIHLTQQDYNTPQSEIKEYLTGTTIEAYKVLVKVDYIEFEDGTTWGSEISTNGLKFLNRELTVSSWAIALATTTKIQQLIEKEGLEVLLRNSDIEPDFDYSAFKIQDFYPKIAMRSVNSMIKIKAREDLLTAKAFLDSIHTEYQRIAAQKLAMSSPKLGDSEK
jgi:antitoxin component HigA of HigAB toxin-antitoxin module